MIKQDGEIPKLFLRIEQKKQNIMEIVYGIGP